MGAGTSGSFRFGLDNLDYLEISLNYIILTATLDEYSRKPDNNIRQISPYLSLEVGDETGFSVQASHRSSIIDHLSSIRAHQLCSPLRNLDTGAYPSPKIGRT